MHWKVKTCWTDCTGVDPCSCCTSNNGYLHKIILKPITLTALDITALGCLFLISAQTSVSQSLMKTVSQRK